MKKYIYVIVILVVTTSVKAQWLWDFGATVGASNYLGDIGGKEKTRRDFVADLKLSQTRWNLGAFGRYKLLPRLSLKLAFDYLRIEGDDNLSSNPGRYYRNWNFRNDILDLGLTGEFFFYENNDLGNTFRYKNGFRAYVFGGIGGFRSNPKSLYRGEWVKLRNLKTEGESYKAMGLNIPLGLGFYFTFNKIHRFGFEVNYRKTFTDYLDDISGNYPDTPPSDPYLQGLILRTNELPQSDLESSNAPLSHVWGAKRGDNSRKDAFITLNLSYSYVIRGKSGFYKANNGSFFGNKRKMRKIRAKF